MHINTSDNNWKGARGQRLGMATGVVSDLVGQGSRQYDVTKRINSRILQGVHGDDDDVHVDDDVNDDYCCLFVVVNTILWVVV